MCATYRLSSRSTTSETNAVRYTSLDRAPHIATRSVKAVMDICIPFIYISLNNSLLSRTIQNHIPLHFVQVDARQKKLQTKILRSKPQRLGKQDSNRSLRCVHPCTPSRASLVVRKIEISDVQRVWVLVMRRSVGMWRLDGGTRY
jgi:hypothetical protein